MRTLRRNQNRTVYVCQRQTINNGVEVYASPQAASVYLEPVINKTSIGITGENHEQYLKGIVTHTDRVGFELHAKIYVDVNPPQTHDPICRAADYVVEQQFDYLSHRLVVLRRVR